MTRTRGQEVTVPEWLEVPLHLNPLCIRKRATPFPTAVWLSRGRANFSGIFSAQVHNSSKWSRNVFLIVSRETQILLGDANVNLNINLHLPGTLSVIKIIHGEANKDIKMQMNGQSLCPGSGVPSRPL